MVNIKLKCSLVILRWIGLLQTVSASRLRHGESREQLIKQERETEEWFEEDRLGKPDPFNAPAPASVNSEFPSGGDAIVKGIEKWPAISAGKYDKDEMWQRHAKETSGVPVPLNHPPILPPHWESAVDKVSGRTYYFDRATKRTQWDPPENATEAFPNVIPMNPNRFEDKRRHTNFKMYKGSPSEQVDLTCLRHTGVACEVQVIGTDLMHSCPQLTGGVSECRGGASGGECRCDPGYCSTSKGHCHTDRSTYVEGTFKISTKGTGKNEYLKMVMDGNGQGYVALSTAVDDASQWRVIKRPDGSHILTTLKYPYAAVDFVKVCTGDNCETVVGLTINPEGSEIGTRLEFAKGGHLVLADTHSPFAFYFPKSKEGKVGKKALGCDLQGYECPTETGVLVFDPPLPPQFHEKLVDVDYEYWKMLGLYVLAGVAFSIVLFVCWYQLFTEVKGSRFY